MASHGRYQRDVQNTSQECLFYHKVSIGIKSIFIWGQNNFLYKLLLDYLIVKEKTDINIRKPTRSYASLCNISYECKGCESLVFTKSGVP